jgi:D-alanyl-D-alanine carboxypeptidase (penicillin-binding protein 5/6)
MIVLRLKRLVALMGIAPLLLIVSPATVWGQAPAIAPAPVVQAKAAELLDGQTGQVLWAKNANQPLPMASVTKLMTLYLAIRAIEAKKLTLDELVPVSEEAYRVGGSQIWLEPGERLPVDQLLRAIAVGSANDAAYALGEYLAGSNTQFVQDMNRTARRLGMRSTHFANPHGLPQAEHYSTAHDLGILAWHAVHMPLLLHYTAMRQDRSIRNGKGGHLWLINHNRLLRQFPGTDGLKTGYTHAAGFCLAATARRGNSRMIAIILGAPSSPVRFQDAANLMSWGFTHYESIPIAVQGRSYGSVNVRHGSRARVSAVAARDGWVTLPRTHPAIATDVNLPRTVTAPIHRGQPLGRLVARAQHHVLTEIPLVAERSIARRSWWHYGWHIFWQLVT